MPYWLLLFAVAGVTCYAARGINGRYAVSSFTPHGSMELPRARRSSMRHKKDLLCCIDL
jgi:hypothetical protein